jgi:hypothetical protein
MSEPPAHRAEEQEVLLGVAGQVPQASTDTPTKTTHQAGAGAWGSALALTERVARAEPTDEIDSWPRCRTDVRCEVLG